ncbi:peptidoglycan DD-metalloendopeptidase family protein [Streptomyces sp. SID4919]|uniref:M23 family metallopeptidase n=1 Tax=unclassified Streptomyces TaxID=2593676 RepID=UPI000823B073|nr:MULTISPECIES: M23 family metallopeptidase [unclassified Streptomyces]MYY10589.1 peptidoglycan DD-metalloendopeptidase family protein [Streptomyces sp. SID4919]SCK47726.1 Membrane proteins related to metalloendopeptidases [Streptomyces sp. AmelKG-E11A]
MAFTRATGKHRRPSRMSRTTANVAGVATLTTTGVIGTLASPALAAEDTSLEDTGLTKTISIGDAVAGEIDAQATAQQIAAQETAAKEHAEAEAKQRAAEQKRQAEADAKKEREARERAAREAERKRLNTFVSPIAGSHVSTSYGAGGAIWSSGTHTGIDFHADTGTVVQSVGYGTVVEAGWGGAYGNNVVIKMHDGTYTQYAHLLSVAVQAGQAVTTGQQIGISGATGNVTGSHLHFEARATADYGSDLDPLAYLRGHGVNL